MRNLLLSSVLVSAALAADRRPADEQAVAAAVDRFNEAARAGDEAALGGLLTEDLTYGHSSASMETKAQCIAALKKGKPNFQHADQKIRVYGKTALVEAKATANVVQNGKPNQIPLLMFQVWVKDGKTWKMAARRTTRIPAP
jgi:ketosteroid isomerase-like protein